MAFVNKQGGQEKRNELAGAGQLFDFDPSDPDTVKVHYDLATWTFDQRAELAEALADAELPHAWDGEELLVPEVVEEQADAVFERLESEIGPFPVVLEDDAPSTEFGLDEWSDADREVLRDALVDAEIPHRWEGLTLVVAEDAEDAVDDLLDAIEAGELFAADDSAPEPPEGALTTIFLAADRLAKDPFDAKSRTALIDLLPRLDAAHPPYAFPPRTWSTAVEQLDTIIGQITSEATSGGSTGDTDNASDVIGTAQELRSLLRPYV